MIVRFPEFVGRWFASSRGHVVLNIWSLVSAAINEEIFVPPERGAFPICFILAYSGPCVFLLQVVYPGICRGRCSRCLAHMQSLCIFKFVLWSVHCNYALCGIYEFTGLRVHCLRITSSLVHESINHKSWGFRNIWSQLLLFFFFISQ